MKHTYHIHGMSCNGCRKHVEETLSKVDGVNAVEVNLEKAEAVIEMEKHIPIKRFEKALEDDGGSYSIHTNGHHHQPKKKEAKRTVSNGNGTFYCPMHCEGDKTYDKPGDCPVCGMDLVEEQNTSTSSKQQWTCPMHPEVVEDSPGSCPKCGMDLVPKEPEASAEIDRNRRV